MPERTVAPYGSWESPISAEEVTRALVRFSDVVRTDGDDVYWVESRPHEGGRSAIVRRTAEGTIVDVGPDDFDARTRLHESGGGAYAVSDGVVYASRFSDQRLYRIGPDGDPVPITPEPTERAGLRYADLEIGGDWAIAVRERHGGGEDEPVNELVRIDLTGATEPTVIAGGRDFYSSPRLSPDGSTLAWLEWDHPNMPWDGTELWVAAVGPDGLGPAETRAGGQDESIFQPEWSPDGVLHWVSDRTGWWNPYRAGSQEPIVDVKAEFGLPGWQFAMRRYAFRPDGAIVAMYETPETDRMVRIDGDEHHEIATPFADLGSTIAMIGNVAHVVAGAPDTATGVVRVDTDTGAFETIRSADTGIDPAYVSTPETLTFDTPDGPAYALYYPPTNPEFTGPAGEAPPLIVEIHGGPTSRARRRLRASFQYWTSRGFAVLDVDYGGSTGYGRAYRDRLRGNWGVVDVRDCALAAAHAAATGRADPNRLIITGGSAGGYTTLLALATRDEFDAGASHFGIADLTALIEHTHKFESRYLDHIVGPYPEAADVYRERSALSHLDGFDAPVILFQGLDDRVVPPEQAEMMRDALIDKGVPVACVMFEGEGHGFREARNQITALESELAFYGRVFGFEPADDLPPVEIVGLE